MGKWKDFMKSLMTTENYNDPKQEKKDRIVYWIAIVLITAVLFLGIVAILSSTSG